MVYRSLNESPGRPCVHTPRMPRSKVVLAAPSNALFDFDGNYKHEQARQAFLATFP